MTMRLVTDNETKIHETVLRWERRRTLIIYAACVGVGVFAGLLLRGWL